jgi:L-asparaginase
MQIKIFTTGGTIDKTYFDARSEYEVGDPQIMDILRIANVRVPYVVETLLRKDSLDLNEDDRRIIVQRIQREPGKRILVTHGTDTMVETAQALESITDKTIVLVGSLNPAKFKNSDAEFNIGFAMAAVQTLEPGAYITMNGRIFSAGNVRKNRERNQFETVD